MNPEITESGGDWLDEGENICPEVGKSAQCYLHTRRSLIKILGY